MQVNVTNYEVSHPGVFVHCPFSYLLGPNIHLRILFLNILSLRSSHNVRDQVQMHLEVSRIMKTSISRYTSRSYPIVKDPGEINL